MKFFVLLSNQASLSLACGGIDIRKIKDLSIPAYFSSLFKFRDISNNQGWDNNTLSVAVTLRLGSRVCERHMCRCGQTVEQNEHHSLSCKFSAGRLSRHATINKIISQGLRTADYPNLLEPSVIKRSHGKRTDGVTITPLVSRQSFVMGLNNFRHSPSYQKFQFPVSILFQYEYSQKHN